MCPRRSVAIEPSGRGLSRVRACVALAGLLSSCLPSSGDLEEYSADWSPPREAPAQLTLPNQMVPGADPDAANAASGAASNAEPSPNPSSQSSELPPTPVAPGAAAPGASGATAGSGSDLPAEPPPSAEPSLPPPAQQCVDGVLDAAQSSCYRVATVRATWQVARGECTTWGGALVKVESADEDQLMGQLVTEDLWLGASDTAFENVFVWTDGSPIVFGNWGAAQPDRFPGPDCVQKRSSEGRQWFDQPCDNAWLYVCERPIQR